MPVLLITPNGVTIQKTSIAAAVTAAGSLTSEILVTSDTVVAASTTVGSNLTLRIVPGALVIVASGKTLTIAGTLITGLTQCFSGLGTVTVTGKPPTFSVSTAAVLREIDPSGGDTAPFPGVVFVQGKSTVSDGLIGVGYTWKAGSYTHDGKTILVKNGGGTGAWLATSTMLNGIISTSVTVAFGGATLSSGAQRDDAAPGITGLTATHHCFITPAIDYDLGAVFYSVVPGADSARIITTNLAGTTVTLPASKVFKIIAIPYVAA